MRVAKLFLLAMLMAALNISPASATHVWYDNDAAIANGSAWARIVHSAKHWPDTDTTLVAQTYGHETLTGGYVKARNVWRRCDGSTQFGAWRWVFNGGGGPDITATRVDFIADCAQWLYSQHHLSQSGGPSTGVTYGVFWTVEYCDPARCIY